MPNQIFVNLPVRDLERSKDFFAAIGYAFEPSCTDDKAACLVLDDSVYVMLLAEPFFSSFTTKDVADATRTAEVIVSLGVESRERVDEVVDRAIAAGGTVSNETNDQGFLYGRSFEDLDGHLWEAFYLDVDAARECG
ncbi:MAG: hypothetical protein GEV10_18955 [Streptosporangiales bacterium]|nr:hypothetical protein [Streptosporangiales bacterium]